MFARLMVGCWIEDASDCFLIRSMLDSNFRQRSHEANMSTEGIFSALRLELRPGEWVLWDARPHRFESLANDRARIRDAATNEIRDVPVAALRAPPFLTALRLASRLDSQRPIDPEDWSLAERREVVIRQALTGKGSTVERVRVAAEELGMSTRAVYRLVARYRTSAQTTSLMPRLRGPNKRRRRLGDIRERLIAEAIERRYLMHPLTAMEEVYRNVKQRCRELSIPAPARGSVLSRIRALDVSHAARRRQDPRAAQSIMRTIPGSLEVRNALEQIQIDHTLADATVVDSRSHRPIGRPWLTVAIDVATRCVLGVHVGLEAPSALAVALCLQHACLPKDRPGNMSSCKESWIMFGLPKEILVDNAPEFHGVALDRGCSEYGITLSCPRVARPRLGGHIERLIGTLLGRVRLLPGSTDASPAMRAGNDAEGEARLTLPEFSKWLSLEIGGQYHHTVHRVLGTTPAAAWAGSLATGVTPAIPADPDRFLLSFLPVAHRRLQHDGLHFERIRYWSDVLPAIAKPHEPLVVRYDPRNLSRLYVMGTDRHYYPVPYANLAHPPISLGELRHIFATLRAQAKGRIDETQVFAMHARQQQTVATGPAAQLERRRGERRRSAPTAPPVSPGDQGLDPAPVSTEIRDCPSLDCGLQGVPE
jgi:putative transposase